MTDPAPAAAFLRERTGAPLDLAVVLGSGLSESIAESFAAEKIEYDAIPGMPAARLRGHGTAALVGDWHGLRTIVFTGRVHLYQGFTADDVTMAVGISAAAGARTLIVTNAAGGLNPAFASGDFMVIADHLNLTGASPLVGTSDPDPFVDMLDAYDPALRALAHRSAATRKIALREGIYAGVVGPAYETRAEATWLRAAGADAVGMSTVLETIRARRLGMRVLGVSVLTNVVGAPAAHAAVTQTSGERGPELARLLDAIVEQLRGLEASA